MRNTAVLDLIGLIAFLPVDWRQFHAFSTVSGSYDEFDLSNENDILEQFLKLAPPTPTPEPATEATTENNGDAKKEVCDDN